MNKPTKNPNSIDPTEYPLNKVPQIVEKQDPAEAVAEESPIEEGIIEEQQGDLEGLDGKNSIESPADESSDQEALREAETNEDEGDDNE
jgi:hypothetical protein